MRAGTGQFGLTRKAQEAKAFIRSYVDQHGGIYPSYAEMMAGLGLQSKSGVHRLLNELEERGHLVRLRHPSGSTPARAFRLIEAPKCHHCGFAFGSPECLARAKITYSASNTQSESKACPTAGSTLPLGTPASRGDKLEGART